MSVVGRGTARTATFRAAMRAGAWQVTRDYVFHSGHETLQQAIVSACAAARDHEARGGSARVLASPGETLIAHQAVASARAG